MLKSVELFKSNETFKKLLSNFVSLVVLQGINYIAPLILLPYLVRVLGIEKFGLWAFALAVTSYFVLLTDYGFEFTATRNISLHRENRQKIEEIYNNTLTIKFLFALLSLFIIVLLTLFIDKFSKNYTLFYILFLSVVGQALFPVWFFQGIEKMKYITFLNFLSKVILLSLIFVFVKTPQDINLVAFFYSLGFLASGIIAQYIIKKDYGISFSFRKLSEIKEDLIEGWYVFTTRITVNLYTAANVVFLGFLASDKVVGYYSVAEKLVVAIGGAFIPLLQTLYPHFAKVYSVSKEKFFKGNKLLSAAIFLTALLLFTIVNLFDEEILLLITGEKPNEYLLRLFHILTLIIFLFPYGGQFTRMLITMEKAKLLNRIVLIAAIINTSLAPVAIHFFSAEGIAWLTVFIGCYIAIVKGYFVYVKN